MQRVSTNFVEMIYYLPFTSTLGSGGRWFKSSRPDQKRGTKPSNGLSQLGGFLLGSLPQQP
jgi:hypothetical protein